MEPFDQYHQYSQNMLLAQHDVSEIIKHRLTRGEVREDFIIQYLGKTINDCDNYLKRGFVNLDKGEQSGQADILLIKKFAEVIDLGNRSNITVNPEGCMMVVEVKSTLTGPYLNDFNGEAQRIKKANSEVVCGMFAYKSALEKKTIMNRFGYNYDSETRTYFDSPDERLPIFYPYIDFILLLDKVQQDESEEELELQGRNQLYLSKATDGARYFIGTHTPVVRNLVGLVRSLLIG